MSTAPTQEILIHWYCGYFLANTGSLFEDPAECEGTLETCEDRDTWDARLCSAICPACGADLWQRDGHGELVERDEEQIEPVDIPPLAGL